MTLGPDKYQCAICSGIFTKGWSDEEADVELAQNFPNTSVEDCDLVCDDCYNEVMKEATK